MEIYDNVQFNQEPESESFIQASTSRQSLFTEAVISAMSVAADIDPYKELLPEGVVVPALDAVDWFGRNVDIRPRLVD